MWNFIRGIFLLILGLICIGIPISCVASCVESCQRENEITRNNTRIEMYIEGPTRGDQDWGDGRVISYATVGFKNVGREDIYRVTCTVNFLDSKGNVMGRAEFNYDPSRTDPVEYGDSSQRYSLNYVNYDGIYASSISITDLKVNDYSMEVVYQ